MEGGRGFRESREIYRDNLNKIKKGIKNPKHYCARGRAAVEVEKSGRFGTRGVVERLIFSKFV